jgi:hypothetical protein
MNFMTRFSVDTFAWEADAMASYSGMVEKINLKECDPNYLNQGLFAN